MRSLHYDPYMQRDVRKEISLRWVLASAGCNSISASVNSPGKASRCLESSSNTLQLTRHKVQQTAISVWAPPRKDWGPVSNGEIDVLWQYRGTLNCMSNSKVILISGRIQYNIFELLKMGGIRLAIGRTSVEMFLYKFRVRRWDQTLRVYIELHSWAKY